MLIFAFGALEAHDVHVCSSASGSLCFSLRSDEKSRSWHHGLLGSDSASEGQVVGDEALRLAYLYDFLRSDAKTGFGRCGL